MLKDDTKVLKWINKSWDIDWPESKWAFALNQFWHQPYEPKKQCFRWLVVLKKIAVGDVLSSVGLSPIVYPLCNTYESVSHLFFEYCYAKRVWSLFIGQPVCWNSKPGLSWIEVLAGYVDGFDLKLNSFWSVLFSEILWFLWIKRNEEVFQSKIRSLIEFNCKLTFLHIMMQVSAVLEIPKNRFMILVQEGASLIDKADIKSSHFFHAYKDMLDQDELQALNQFLQEKEISKEDIEKVNQSPKLSDAPKWDTVAAPETGEI
ncbi:hypothetical protein SUGI_0689280 [Cryptomeria japonica]|nr:hypothetical protein SUGI_0689280 [Cryptomeria japonica]